MEKERTESSSSVRCSSANTREYLSILANDDAIQRQRTIERERRTNETKMRTMHSLSVHVSVQSIAHCLVQSLMLCTLARAEGLRDRTEETEQMRTSSQSP